ncbi:hypothetical protein FB45DRAFT_1152880 [Roridomyces roridus]|uniref:Uncharacterized protein n=1 Tax=Roridomyces roridus TaxID=1738132 RepID=A0AAD7FLF3_9AGAR|nr:hypothetical protein FB45DRAFT_1152880 [Roridomyces roridus]
MQDAADLLLAGVANQQPHVQDAARQSKSLVDSLPTQSSTTSPTSFVPCQRRVSTFVLASSSESSRNSCNPRADWAATIKDVVVVVADATKVLVADGGLVASRVLAGIKCRRTRRAEAFCRGAKKLCSSHRFPLGFVVNGFNHAPLVLPHGLAAPANVLECCR